VTGIYVNENEPIDIAFKKFKKVCEREGILTELKKREFYEKPSIKRKKKSYCCKEKTIKET
jgi:small subunit ribosomal protein S21